MNDFFIFLNNLSSKKLLEILDDDPKEHEHCPTFAVNTLHRVIENYHKD